MNAGRGAFDFDWGQCDANLRGPYFKPAQSRATPFAVSAGTASDFVFAQVRSGPSYPDFLTPFDRLVPLHGLAAAELPDTGDASAVLSYRDEHGDWRPLATAERDVVRWRLDPRAWIQAVLNEEYVAHWTRPITSRIPLINYARAPGYLKGVIQRGTAAGRDRSEQSKRGFPTPPLDDFVDVLRRLCAALCWGQPAEILDLWPERRRAAVTITHDVDTGWIFQRRNRGVFRQILDAESSLGFRGGWFIPAAFYHRRSHEAALQQLERAGHELGSHGWNHDTKLGYQSARQQQRRLERIADRFSPRRVTGIRTPWYSRNPQLFEQLSSHFRYDSSVPNASGLFSIGSNSGCCTVFPYRTVGGLMELPLTLPPDDVIDPAAGYAAARRSADTIVEHGGVIVVILHPQPHQSANHSGILQFTRFLEWLRTTHGERLWSATPAEIVARYCLRTGIDPAHGGRGSQPESDSVADVRS